MPVAKDKSRPRVLLFIPIYNEQCHIDAVLDEAGRYIDDILVIDDGSTDGSKGILTRRGNIFLITHGRNRGYGQVLREAFAFARDQDYDWLITMDCDFQHEPAWIPRIRALMEEGGADVVSGSRYMSDSPCHTPPPPDRRGINKTITELLNEKLRLNLTDAFCGFKAYRVKALADLRLTESGYAFPLEFWVQAAAHGLRIREIPVGLIYCDYRRGFGGGLDDPEERLRHYKEVLEAALRRAGGGAGPLREAAGPEVKTGATNKYDFDVPEEEGGVVVHPELSRWAGLMAANKAHTRDLPGKTEAREELLGRARDYTSEVCGLSSSAVGPSDYIIATGHQAVWHHGGIWAKDAAASGCAQGVLGGGIHLVLDHDISDTALVLPGRDRSGGWFFDKLRFETSGEGIPLEGRPAPGPERLEESRMTIKQRSSEIPKLGEGVKVAELLSKQPAVIKNMADFICRVQANISRQLGINLLYLPVSGLTQSNAFMDFTASIIFQARRFAEIYNEGIPSDKGVKEGIRRLDINAAERHIELPFWMVSPEGVRSTLFVKEAESGAIFLYGDRNRRGRLGGSGKELRAGELRAVLEEAGFSLRPKAVSLTLFVRVYLADWFIHGAGGARYEKITDRLIEDYYQLKPLSFGVVTATMRLPLTNPGKEQDDIAELEHKLHHARHNPEKYLDEAMRRRNAVGSLISQKQAILDQMQGGALSKAEKNKNWEQLKQTNVLLGEHAREAVEQIQARMERARSYNRSIKVCRYREYFFGLFPAGILRDLAAKFEIRG